MNSENIITSPMNYSSILKDRAELFLAGSIEMGQAEDWQSEVMVVLQEYINRGKLRIYNPRRIDWNPEWSQDGEHPELKKQIQWELIALERVDAILFYFQPGTLSPISLLEFGLHARSGKSVVICPPGFWRRANVLTTAEMYNVPVVSNLQEGIRKIIERIQG